MDFILRKAYEAPVSETLDLTIERQVLVSQSDVMKLGLFLGYGDDDIENRNNAGYWGGNENWH